MFIMNIRLTKLKAIIATLLGGLVLCILIFLAAAHHESSKPLPMPENRAGIEGCVDYLQELGWEVDPSPVETLDIVLPPTLDETFSAYNELQRKQGFDLSTHCGKSLQRVTFTVQNFPDAPETVHANLYLVENTVAAGDITVEGAEGFVTGLRFPD